MQIQFINQSNKFFQDVINLGKKHSATLGFMPDGGFEDHAKKECIIIAHDDSELCGYLMFRVVNSSSRISIVHLCVNEAHRGKNLSSLLLDKLRLKYENTFAGIALSCRQDYKHASALWERYGFHCRHTKRSRSLAENYLNIWWYDFNKQDLFSVAASSSFKIKAILDANIIVKLRDNDVQYDAHEDPRGLVADWLADEVDYYYASEMLNEINRDANKDRANKTRMFLNNFIEAKHDVEERKTVAELLKQIIKGQTDNDNSDRVQLATCIVSNVSYFITQDIGILDCREKIEDQFNKIQIFSPQEFIIEVDQLLNKEEYSPIRLAGVTFHTISKVSTNELDACIDKFLVKESSEKKNSFKSIVYTEASNTDVAKIKVIKSSNDPIAFFAYSNTNLELRIPFIRLIESEYKQTLFMQIISDLVNKAIKKNINVISLNEVYLSDSQVLVLSKLGFEHGENSWRKHVYNEIIESSNLANLQNLSDGKIRNIILDIASNNKTELMLLDIERKLFPLKILDLNIPCYIIPIKALWAGQLFDTHISGATLFGAIPNKLWNVENVYYRHTKPITEIAPARILWYVSNDKYIQRSKSIVATSYLDEVITGKPKELFAKNKHYGVYEWKHIYDLCEQNINSDIRALRFSGTEVFQQPVSFSSITEVFEENGRKRNSFASPVKVDLNIFNRIYQLGKWKI